MAEVHIYAVVDENGVVLNTILVDYPPPEGYWPGYGHGMIDLGPAPADPEQPPIPEKDPDFGVIEVDLGGEAVAIGDTVDLVTGEVTPKPIEIIEIPPEEIIPE